MNNVSDAFRLFAEVTPEHTRAWDAAEAVRP